MTAETISQSPAWFERRHLGVYIILMCSSAESKVSNVTSLPSSPTVYVPDLGQRNDGLKQEPSEANGTRIGLFGEFIW